MQWITGLTRRLVVAVLGGGLLAGGVYVALVAAGVVHPTDVGFGGVTMTLSQLSVAEWLPVAIGAILVGLVLTLSALYIPLRRAKKISLPSDAADGLSVRVSPSTMRSLVTHEARQIQGVREVYPRIRIQDGGWDVGCELVVWRGMSMMEVSEAVTQRLGEALHHHTGLNMVNVDIDVSQARDVPTSKVQ